MRRFFVALAMVATMLAPLGANANDRQIAEQIIRILKQRKDAGELKGFNINLEVDQGDVWLKGHVTGAEQEKLALEIVRDIEGVSKVFSDIEVRGEQPAGPAPQRRNRADRLATEAPAVAESVEAVNRLVSSAEELDNTRNQSQQIAHELAAKLRAEQEQGNLRGFGIDVQVNNGILSLKGTTASEEQRHLILEIARRIQGVEKVINKISIADPDEVQQASADTAEADRSSRRRTEQAEPILVDATPIQEDNAEVLAEEISKRIKTQQQFGALRDFRIDVQVDEGVVWMSGSVANKEQHALALDMARYVPGVKQVVNDLSITEPLEDITPEPIKESQPEEMFASQPIPTELPHEPQASPLRPHTEFQDAPLRQPTQPQQQVAAQPQVAAQQQPAAQPQAPSWSYVPTGPNSRFVGYALVNTGGNQPQPQMQPIAQPQQMIQPVANRLQTPLPFAPARPVQYTQQMQSGQPVPMMGANGVGVAPARFDHPQLPGYAWPSYAAHPNYGAVTYPKQYSAQAWPYIGPFYPYPQVPLGWRKVTLEWDDGWWQLDFKARH